MTAGDGIVLYFGRNFLTVVEAQWAVFFETMDDPWDYDPAAEWVLTNPQHYRPQFSLSRLGAYLEVQRLDDRRTRQPLQHHYPEIEEPPVYLAVGDPPDEQQLRNTGWWDPVRLQGVRKLTPGYDWEAWFPPDSSSVLRAIEVARTEEFGSAIPQMRQPGGREVKDIPEREREERPEPGGAGA